MLFRSKIGFFFFLIQNIKIVVVTKRCLIRLDYSVLYLSIYQKVFKAKISTAQKLIEIQNPALFIFHY